jgi:hypothetical protein
LCPCFIMLMMDTLSMPIHTMNCDLLHAMDMTLGEGNYANEIYVIHICYPIIQVI